MTPLINPGACNQIAFGHTNAHSQCPAQTIAPRQLSCGKTCGKLARGLWKTILSGWKKFLMRKGWAIEYTNFSTSFPQVVIPQKAYWAGISIYFPQFTQRDRPEN